VGDGARAWADGHHRRDADSLGKLFAAGALIFIELGLVFRDGLGSGGREGPAAAGMGLGWRVASGLGLNLNGTDR